MLKWYVVGILLVTLSSPVYAGEKCRYQSRSSGEIECHYSVVKAKDKLQEWAQNFCADRGKNLSYKGKEFLNCDQSGEQCMILKGKCK